MAIDIEHMWCTQSLVTTNLERRSKYKVSRDRLRGCLKREVKRERERGGERG